MDILRATIDLFLNLDTHLQTVIEDFGPLTYGILFVVIFCETGLVVMPFLPGDSLLFAAGAFAAVGSLHPIILFVLLSIAAIIGDSCNYALGKRIGRKAFSLNSRWLNRGHLLKAEQFYERYGGKAIILARFVPTIRTLAPFVAGIGAMSYSRFLFFNVFGGVLWVALFVFAGYFFGQIPIVKENFETVIIAIIVISLIPPLIEYVKHRRGE